MLSRPFGASVFPRRPRRGRESMPPPESLNFATKTRARKSMHVCLFDIDGTLISSGGAGKAALEAALAEEFGLAPITARLELSGRTDRSICRDLFRHHVLDETPENWQRLTAAYLRHLPRCLDGKGGRVLPGVAALLERLRVRDDVLLGLLTGNIRAGAEVKLGHFGLFEQFRVGGF